MLAGSLMMTVCLIAIAMIGLAMLAGRFEFPRGVRVILGYSTALGARMTDIRPGNTAQIEEAEQ